MSEITLSSATILWLVVPQALIILLSLANFILQRKKARS